MDQVTRSERLRASKSSELDANALEDAPATSARLTRLRSDEIAAIAATLEIPANVTDVAMSAEVTPGGLLPNGTPDGKGGATVYGPVWIISGRGKSPLVHAFESQRDAHDLHDMLVGERGELWTRKQRRLAAIAAMEAAEAEELAISKENARTVARSNEDGGGSSRPSRSSAKRSASTGERSGGRRERLRQASRTTPSQQASS